MKIYSKLFLALLCALSISQSYAFDLKTIKNLGIAALEIGGGAAIAAIGAAIYKIGDTEYTATTYFIPKDAFCDSEDSVVSQEDITPKKINDALRANNFAIVRKYYLSKDEKVNLVKKANPSFQSNTSEENGFVLYRPVTLRLFGGVLEKHMYKHEYYSGCYTGYEIQTIERKSKSSMAKTIGFGLFASGIGFALSSLWKQLKESDSSLF
jgi:hypothetical protein